LERPILFSTPLVKAILDGKKTQTRRVVKPNVLDRFINIIWNPSENLCFSPYKVGDILWVRETWLKADDGHYYKADETSNSKELRETYGYKWKPSIHMPRSVARVFLKVTAIRLERLLQITEEDAIAEGIRAWTKDESLYKYCVGEVGENGNVWQDLPRTAKEAFLLFWDKITYKNDTTRFKTECGQFLSKSNPWVWVIEFERI
jgi:hypothetical protein